MVRRRTYANGTKQTAGIRCYFNVQPGSDYCPGHQDDHDGPCDVEAVGRYQAEHGVDYPCGKEDDTVRLFNVCPTCGVRMDGEGEAVHSEECYRLGGIGGQYADALANYDPPPEDLPNPVRVDAHFIGGGVPVPITPEDRDERLAAADSALEALDDYAARVGPPKRRLRTVDYLAGTVTLSNKGCPRYYRAVRDPDPDDPASGPKRCGCPHGECWYDAQLARRARSELALTSEAWLALIAGRAEEPPEDEKADTEYTRAVRLEKGTLTLEEAQAGLKRTQDELSALREARADDRGDAGAGRAVPMDQGPATRPRLERATGSQGSPGTIKRKKKRPRSVIDDE